MKSKVLEVRNLSKKFGKHEVLHDVSFNIYENEIVGFVGPNGAGKSTTMKCIAALYKFDKGQIEVMGEDVTKHRTKALSYMGVSIESPALYPDANGYDHFAMVANWRKIPKERLEEYYTFSGLHDALKKPVHTYSMGMKQRLILALSIMGDPTLLILDEPMNGLDPQATFELREKLQDLKEKHTSVFISSHMLSEIEKICDRIIFIKNGDIIDAIQENQFLHYQMKLQPKKDAFAICKALHLNVVEEHDVLYIRFPSVLIFNEFLRNIIKANIEVQFISMNNQLEEYYKDLYKDDTQ